MQRIAIIGGGISGLTAAYELEKARKNGREIDWQLYEASDRLGGVIQTLRQDGFVLEGGPDGWVTEKVAARELAVELGLENELLASCDETRKTYVLMNGELQAIPDRMRMMVPESLETLEKSPLFSASACAAYAAEPARAAELKAAAPQADESVAAFVLRHFGEEVLEKIAAPLLGGVFGGDVYKLSVQAVMPQFVAMEREHGSLITALQSRTKPVRSSSIFTSLRGGMQTLTDALAARLPPDRIHLKTKVEKLPEDADAVFVATSLEATRGFLAELEEFLPVRASSAVLAALAWKNANFNIPKGFGFLVPSGNLLAGTFVDQKFPERAPAGGKILRAFFGGEAALWLMGSSDAEVAQEAQHELNQILGPLPVPDIIHVTRWPNSLPQYEVGHRERVKRLHAMLEKTPGIHLLGNMLDGVGIPDLVRQARFATMKMLEHAR